MHEFEAELLMDAAHAAWCAGDIAGALKLFTDDFDYQCNAGTTDGTPLTLKGKEMFAGFWGPIVSQLQMTTVPESVKLHGDVARVHVTAKVRHARTGHELEGTYRQIVTFRDGKICALEEYHDAAKMAAFWSMVSHDELLAAPRSGRFKTI